MWMIQNLKTDDGDAKESITDVLVESSDEVGLQENIEKTKQITTNRRAGVSCIKIKNENMKAVNYNSLEHM